MSGIDLAVIVLYLAATVALGLWVGRNASDPNAFMAAEGRVPTWAVGLSIFGTYVSSISFLAIPGKAYGGNWNPFVFSLAIPLAAWISVTWFVPFYRRMGEISAYEHLERRFGPWARLYAVTCYILLQLARTGAILYMVGLLLSELVPLPIEVLILTAGAVVIVYTCFGGMEAVIWTDVMQSIVLIGGALVCAGLLLFGMPQGPGQLFAVGNAHGKFSLGSFALDFTQTTFWVTLIYGLFLNLQNFGIDQSYVQRYHTATSEREASRSVWLGAMLYLPISAVFLFIGTGLYVFYSLRPELLAAGLKDDKVFPYFIVHQLPVGLTGLVLAAVLAAAQSTVSSSLNCAATLLLCDVWKRRIRPAADDAECLRVLRGATFTVGVLGTLAALGMMHIKSALDAWWQWAGILSGGMLGLFLLGRLVPRAGNLAGLIGVGAGTAAIAWTTFSPNWEWLPATYRSALDPLLAVVVGTLTVLAAGGLTAFLRPVATSEPEKISVPAPTSK